MAKPNNTTPHFASDYDMHIADTIPYHSFHLETLNIIKAIGNEPKSWLDTGCGTGSLIKRQWMSSPKRVSYWLTHHQICWNRPRKNYRSITLSD